MDLLTPAPPFTERLQFLARFARPGGHTDPVQVALDYSLVAPGDISGAVLGGPAAQQAIYQATRAPYLSFVSEPASPPFHLNREVRSDRTALGTLTAINTATEGLIRRAADLRILDLTTDESREDSPGWARSAVFYLYGPTNIWGLQPDIEAFMQGRTEYTNTDLGLSVGRLRVEVDAEIHRQVDPEDRQLLLQRSVHTLTVHTDATAKDLPDEDFIADARELADDLLILASLAAKTWIGWFRYTVYSGRRVVRHVRALAREPETRFRHDDQMIVPQTRLRAFLQAALPRYREAQNDLHLAILTHVGAKDLRYAEAQFLSRFTVLEALRTQFARREGLEQILRNGEARRVRRTLRDALHTLDLPSETARAIERKIPELNRPSFTTILDLLLADLDVRLDDLYPPGAQPTLVRTRNRLVHGDITSTDGIEFFREATRLAVLLDRLLLRSLGWVDLSGVPPRHDLDWLRRPTS